MKPDITSHRGQLSRARLNLLQAIATAGLLLSGLSSATSRADQVLLSAPSANSSYYGMYTPDVTAGSFTLASSSFVSTIDVVLRTPASTSFTNFDFSLQNAVINPSTIFASQELTAQLGAVSTEVMSVNQTLLAGTYYLAGIVPGYAGTPVTPGDVDGWMLSTGVYTGAVGTIANGVWVGSNPPVFDNGSGFVAPAFTVNGSTVPEPATWAMLAAGIASVLALRRRKELQTHL